MPIFIDCSLRRWVLLRYIGIMSSALYRALIEAGASEDKTAAASQEQERIFRLEKDIADIKGRLNLLIALVVPLLVVIIVRLFGIA